MTKRTPSDQRDRMVSELRLRKKSEWIDEAFQTLEAYLKKNKLRQTVERKAVLETIYRLNGPVDIETLYQLMDMDMHVSKTTVYNVLELLVKAKLVRQVSLIEGGMSFYERTIHQQPHGFTVCRYCGKVTAINRPEEIGEWLEGVPKTFRIEKISFVVHGICKKCQDAERKAIKRMEERRRQHVPNPPKRTSETTAKAGTSQTDSKKTKKT